jgi:transposase
MLAAFARETGAGHRRRILLVLDNAGWHAPPDLAVPDGVRLVFLPPYTPELQPAETLWVHVDEPAVNCSFETLAELDAVVARRCIDLAEDREKIKGQTGFHWWPQRREPN